MDNDAKDGVLCQEKNAHAVEHRSGKATDDRADDDDDIPRGIRGAEQVEDRQHEQKHGRVHRPELEATG